MKRKLRKNCIICEKEIFRGNNPRNLKIRRGKHNVTCSKKCSKIYNRIFNYCVQPYFKKMKILEEKLKEYEK